MCVFEPSEPETPSRVWGWVTRGDLGIHGPSSKGDSRVGIVAVQMWFSD